MIGNVAVHQIAIAVIAPTSGEGKTDGDAARAAVQLAVDRLHDDASRTLPVDAIEVVDLDGGRATSEDLVAAADVVRSRTEIVAVIVAMPVSSVRETIERLRGSGSGAAVVQGTAIERGLADVDVAPTDDDVARAMADLVGSQLHARQPALVVDGASAATLASAIRELEHGVERFGMKLAYQTFPFTVNGGIDPLGDLAASGPDVICLAGNSDQLDQVIREYRLHQLTVDFVLPPDFDEPDVRAAIASAGARAYLLVPFAADVDDGPAHVFAEALHQRTGVPATIDAAIAYDAAAIAIEGVRRADNPFDPASVRAAIAAGLADVPGATGALQVDRAGQVRRAFVARELYGDDDRPAFIVSP